MRQNNTKAFRLRLIRIGRRRKQSGELSLIEAGAYMAERGRGARCDRSGRGVARWPARTLRCPFRR